MKKTMLFAGLIALSIMDMPAMEKTTATVGDFSKSISQNIAAKTLHLILYSLELTDTDLGKIELLLTEVDILNDDLAKDLYWDLIREYEELYFPKKRYALPRLGRRTRINNLILSTGLKSSNAAIKKAVLDHITEDHYRDQLHWGEMTPETLRNMQVLINEIDFLDKDLAWKLLKTFAEEDEVLASDERIALHPGALHPLEEIKNKRASLSALKAAVQAKKR
jgi:hypothetical protein